jgi:hypothetical protein
MKGLSEEVGCDLYFWCWDPFEQKMWGLSFCVQTFLIMASQTAPLGEGAF